MSKLKRLSLIFVAIAFAMSILSISTLNTFFIIGGIVSFSIALFYTYINKARKTFKKDVLENLK
jgi:1,4-dihydroxy-2-naphthoate octaprenyltransferase